MTTQNPEIQEILDLYSPEKELPTLDALSQLAILGHFKAQGLSTIAGILPLEKEEITDIKTLLAVDTDTEMSLIENPGSFIGPYFLGDTYYAEGIGIWAQSDK